MSRAEFVRRSTVGLGAVAVASALPTRSAAGEAPVSATAAAGSVAAEEYDLREFVRWVTAEFEPSVRLPGGAGQYARAIGETSTELYGVADMACILYTLNALRPNERERQEWAAAFQTFQNPETGWLLEKSPTHAPLHNTAFALAAMQLLDLAPKHAVRIGAEFAEPRAFLETLDWKKAVYSGSHQGAGIGSIHALVPELNSPAWFEKYFAFCDSLFDPNNGLMGREKPAGGDSDQVGGTFHYQFLYETFNRFMPYPERRIDTVIGLQQPDGYWHATNHLWLTFDAIYLLTRTVRYCPYRFADIQQVIRRTLSVLMHDVYSPDGRRETFAGKMPVHSLTAALSILAEAQHFLGAQEVITERPLKLILNRRPFI